MKKKNYRKNESDYNHTLSLSFFRIFSQRILGAGPKGLRILHIWVIKKKNNKKEKLVNFMMIDQFITPGYATG